MSDHSSKKVKRYKLRKCIRKDTFRFVFEAEDLNEVWEKLKISYGEDVFIKGFDAYQIENEIFILRAFMKTNTLSLIAKKKYTKEEEEKFLELINFEA